MILLKGIVLSQQKQNKDVGSAVVKIILVFALFLFTLGFMSMFEHANNGMKGDH